MVNIDLTDVFDEDYSNEINTYRHFVSIFINQIFLHHFEKKGLLKKRTYRQLTDPESHPSLTAYHFTRKMLEYYLDKGYISIADDDYLIIQRSVVDDDPGDAKLNEYLQCCPDRRNFFGILTNIRDVIGDVLFKGEDALLTLANNNFHQAMDLWEDLMVNARVKKPCHQLVLRAMKKKLGTKDTISIFEGGAGVGSIIRDAISDNEIYGQLSKIERYYFTDISLSLIKIGREYLRKNITNNIFDRFEFKVVNLDKMEIDTMPFTKGNSMDMIILEHVLYDVIDLDATLRLFHHMLKPDGFLVFTMAYRSRPKDFFPFEYLQSTFQSYNKAKLEPGFRENLGYLTVKEWEKSLKKAGFDQFDIHPSAEFQTKWPYGGIIASPSK